MKPAGFIRYEFLRLVSIACILLFAILPLLTLFFHVGSADWQFIFQDGSFKEAVVNSLVYTGVSAVITTVLALAAAYLLDTSCLRRKNLFVILLTLGMLVPTISVGLGLRILFGTNGFLDLLFGIENDRISIEIVFTLEHELKGSTTHSARSKINLVIGLAQIKFRVRKHLFAIDQPRIILVCSMHQLSIEIAEPYLHREGAKHSLFVKLVQQRIAVLDIHAFDLALEAKEAGIRLLSKNAKGCTREQRKYQGDD